MSDAPQGQGWWQASDGRWYSPEQTPQPPAPRPPKSDHEVKTSNRKWLIAVLVVVAGMTALGVAVSFSDDDTSTPEPSGFDRESTQGVVDLWWADMNSSEKADFCASARLEGLEAKVAGMTEQIDPSFDRRQLRQWLIATCGAG